MNISLSYGHLFSVLFFSDSQCRTVGAESVLNTCIQCGCSQWRSLTGVQFSSCAVNKPLLTRMMQIVCVTGYVDCSERLPLSIWHDITVCSHLIKPWLRLAVVSTCTVKLRRYVLNKTLNKDKCCSCSATSSLVTD